MYSLYFQIARKIGSVQIKIKNARSFRYEDSLSRGLILKSLIIIYFVNKHDAIGLTLTRMHETNIIFPSLAPFSETILPRETTHTRGSFEGRWSSMENKRVGKSRSFVFRDNNWTQPREQERGRFTGMSQIEFEISGRCKRLVYRPFPCSADCRPPESD